MSTWYSPYHEALLVRLLSLAIIFGVFWPVLWLLLATVVRLTRHFVRRIGPDTQLGHGHVS